MVAGFEAACFNVIGTVMLNYAASYGLAGPASAMQQFQGPVHVALSAYF